MAGIEDLKARRQQEQMADIEFQMGVASGMPEGARPVDVSKARYYGLPAEERSNKGLNLRGKYTPKGYNEEMRAAGRNPEKSYTSSKTGKTHTIPAEDDTVSAIDKSAVDKTWAHEYTHEQDMQDGRQDVGHTDIYNRTVVTARNELEFFNALTGWANFRAKKSTDPEWRLYRAADAVYKAMTTGEVGGSKVTPEELTAAKIAVKKSFRELQDRTLPASVDKLGKVSPYFRNNLKDLTDDSNYKQLNKKINSDAFQKKYGNMSKRKRKKATQTERERLEQMYDLPKDFSAGGRVKLI